MRWKALSEEERATYKEQAQQNKEAAAAAAAEQQLQQGEEEGRDGEQGEQQPEASTSHAKAASLPMSLVKRIITCDPDVQRVSHGAVLVAATAAEMFIEMMAERCGNTALHARPRRKTVKVCACVCACVCGCVRLLCVCLCGLEVMQHQPEFKEHAHRTSSSPAHSHTTHPPLLHSRAHTLTYTCTPEAG